MVLALFLRFYNFYDHLAFQSDTTRDISIAKGAIVRRELPYVGSFSSAGPFVFGPIFYWFLITVYLILPFSVISPWIVTGFVGILTIAALAYIGKLIGGGRFSLILVVLSATSPQLVFTSLSLTQHSFIIITTLVMLIFFVLFWQKGKTLYAFLVGISLGAAISFHYQALNLLLIPAAFLFAPMHFKKRVLGIVFVIVGMLAVISPLLIWDSKQNWANFRNLLDYLLIGQYRIYVPNSWKLYLFSYLPQYWSQVAGGFKFLALGLIAIIGIVSIYFFKKNKIEKPLFTLGLIFFILILINRYYKGERSAGYLYYLSPFVLLFSSWTIYKISYLKFRFNLKHLGIILASLLIMAISIGNLSVVLPTTLKQDRDSQLGDLQKITKLLREKYGDNRLDLYEYTQTDRNSLYSLSVFVEEINDKVNNDNKVNVGICGTCPQGSIYFANHWGNQLIELNDIQLKDSGWRKINQATIYDSTIGWLMAGNLKSTFSLSQFIKDKLSM